MTSSWLPDAAAIASCRAVGIGVLVAHVPGLCVMSALTPSV